MTTVSLAGREHAVANIFCIGRNYAAHASELGNAVETDEPLVFLKPTSSLLREPDPVRLPVWSDDIHHECELVLLVGRDARDLAPTEAMSAIAGYGIGLDLTARDVQAAMKAKGQPWTKSKGFPGASCVSAFVAAGQVAAERFTFSLQVNGETRQHGDTALMLFPLPVIVSYLSTQYGLTAGDLIYTGTPEGVARIAAGDRLVLTLDGVVSAGFGVI